MLRRDMNSGHFKFFKQGDIWRRNKMTNLNLFKCHLREIAEKKLGKGWQGKIAAFVNVRPAMVSYWADLQEIPPDDTQCLIAMYLDLKSRDEIWEFRQDLFPEMKAVIEAENILKAARDKFQVKVDEYLPGGGHE